MARRGSGASRLIMGAASSQRRLSSFALRMAKLRERAVREGFFGGNRLWMAVGVVTWASRFIYLAVRHRPEVVYTARLKKGESLTVIEHPPGWRP